MAISGNIFGRYNKRGDDTREAREAAQYFTTQATAPPTTKNCPTQNVRRVVLRLKNPSPRKIIFLGLFFILKYNKTIKMKTSDTSSTLYINSLTIYIVKHHYQGCSCSVEFTC